MKKIILTALLVLGLSSLGAAETIYLKSGEVIKAPITKDMGYAIQIMEGSFPKTFRKDEIDRIEPDDAPPPEAANAAEEALTEEKRELIARLMEANGVRENITQTLKQVLETLPEKDQAAYQKIFNTEEIITRLVPVYAKHYKIEELREIVTFYKSPVGQKHIQNTPLVMRDSMAETIKYFQEKTSLQKPSAAAQ